MWDKLFEETKTHTKQNQTHINTRISFQIYFKLKTKFSKQIFKTKNFVANKIQIYNIKYAIAIAQTHQS